LSTKLESSADKQKTDPVLGDPIRHKLPDERPSITHKFSVGGHEGYLTVGLYPDTQMPGEIFLRMSKEGSTISGLMDGFATAISLALQYGVPLSTMVDKFIHSRFEPSGFTGNKDIPMAKSVMDYIFRWLALKFLQKEERHNVGLIADNPPEELNLPAKINLLTTTQNGGAKAEMSKNSFTDHERATFRLQSDAPPCPDCGALCIRSGACYKCPQCGTSLGCS
jgi:ribonucleoside-diphosphate reductase alpha chain